MDIKSIDKINIDKLIEGYQYYCLPDDLLLGDIKENIVDIVLKILQNSNNYCYKFNDDLIDIEHISNVSSPSYIFNFGSEPISFFDFKKNGAYREIQIPNLVFYIGFIYNSIISFESVFDKVYSHDNDFTKYSNSYVVFENEFTIHNDYDNTTEKIMGGEFATRNNKTVNQLTSKERTENYLEKMSSKLYVLKLDIESFYPNIYTHLLSSIKNRMPYDKLIDNKKYFDFLDKYNMKVGANQTKGIMAGCFSSNISSELLMLCVDYEISQYVKEKNIAYIRYVDDFTFFSDSKEQLENIISYVQKVLNKYKLRINHTKTKISPNLLFTDSLDFNAIDNDFRLINEIWSDYNDFIQLKRLFEKYLKLGQISELKVMLSRIAKNIKEETIHFELFETNKMIKYMVNYIIQLIFYDTNLAVNCYKVLDELFTYYKKMDLDSDELMESLAEKNEQINELFSNSLIQIWHYYILNKHGNQKNIFKYYFDLSDQTNKQNESINPLVLSTFIEKGDNKNGDLFKYIIQEYKKTISDEKKWKTTIMLSKWWLPILKIRNVDKKNYYKFYSANNFLPIWEDLSK